MAGYIGNKAVGINVTTGDILGDVGVGGNIDVDGISNLDVVDIDGAVNMATTALVTGVLTTTAATVFNGGFAANAASTITTADNLTGLTVASTDADAGVGPTIQLFRNSSSPADNDLAGNLLFVAENDASEATVYANLGAHLQDVTNGTEDGKFFINTMVGGAEKNRMFMNNTETVLNEESQDLDFRVESNGNANMLFVDGGNNSVLFNKINGDDTVTGVNFDPSSEESYAFTHSVGDGWVMMLNRQANDGVFINFRQANAFEGSIAVSGSTVSYNGFAGRHESSGIATNTAKGTVVSTINELDTYPADSGKAGQTRADHAKVKVSDSVGDARVYGVVDNFDENDKLFVVSVGIAPVKVTGSCSGGDLLESNGDGTAKVQSDDIVRSKTIGKVTIGNSSTGVKLVSCVMYCG